MSEYELPTAIGFTFHTGVVELDCTIYFRVTHWGTKGSRDEPPSGPEFEVDRVWIDEIEDALNVEIFDDPTQGRLEGAVEEYIYTGRLQYDIQQSDADFERG